MTMVRRHAPWLCLVLLVQLILKIAVYTDTVTPSSVVIETVHGYFSSAPWRLLLPVSLEPGHVYWSTTTIVPYVVLLAWLGPKGAYLLVNALVAVLAYASAMVVMRDKVLAATWALMMGIGTHLSYAFVASNLNSSYLYLAYLQPLLAVAALLAQGGGKASRRGSAFAGLLLIVALAWDQWLNLGVWLVVSCLGLLLWNRRHGCLSNAGLRFILFSTLATMTLHLAIRLGTAEQFVSKGHEEELILNYLPGLWILAVEDVISNIFTYIYLSFSSWAPSFIISSNSLITYGRDIIISSQNGYHAEYQHLAGMSHVFFWRYYAGALGLGFIVFFHRSLRGAQASPRIADLIPPLLCALVLSGFSVHLLIKYRPYLSVPALHYKVILSIVGSGLLLLWFLSKMRAGQPRTRGTMIVAAFWGVMILNALMRPGALKALLAEVGLLGRAIPFADPIWKSFVPYGPELKRLISMLAN